MTIRAIIIAAGFIATPVLAQTSAIPLPPHAGAHDINAPVSSAYPAAPMAGPQPGRTAWLDECRRRLDATPGADVTLSPGACQSWWAYYAGGGAPNPTYGYAIPVSVTETVTPDCPPQAIVKKRVIGRKILRDKRIAL